MSYPTPVLGNRDDILEGSIDPKVIYKVFKEIIRLEISNLTSGNERLDSMLSSGNAEWHIKIHCAKTHMRQSFTTSENSFKIALVAADYDGLVEVEVTLLACVFQKDHDPVGAHSDYDGERFDLERGQVLGISPKQRFPITKDFDPLRSPVSSIMRVRKGDFKKGPFKVILDEEDYIIIDLASEDYEQQYHGISKRLDSYLHATIVLTALYRAILKIETYANSYTWAERLMAIMMHKGLYNNNCDPLQVAQELLNMPLTRSMRDLNYKLDQDTN